MIVMGQEIWDHTEKDFDFQLQERALYPLQLHTVGPGALRRKIGQAAGLGPVMGEPMIGSSGHGS